MDKEKKLHTLCDQLGINFVSMSKEQAILLKKEYGEGISFFGTRYISPDGSFDGDGYYAVLL